MEQFGRPVAPKYFDNIEKYKTPDSLQPLDADSAQILKDYLICAVRGLLIPRIAHKNLIILWLIDEYGVCWFCLEEMYKADSENTVFPRLDGVTYPEGYEKLGHPSLISAKRARIAGEITWVSGNRWRISNKSGRYGIRPDIKLDHLAEAKGLFESHGILLETHYIPYPE